jgi:MFS transporter, DHA1 family, multidrug resistance protein
MDKRRQNMVLLILGGLSGLGPFAVDMYVPGFSAIARDLKTTAGLVGLTLTTFALGIAIGQLLAGPVLDRFGRKIPIILGLLVFIAASVGSIFAPTIYLLIALRFFLALGCCVGMVGSNAIVRDLFSGSDMARALSIMMMIFGVAPVIAPTIGGFVVGAVGWRAIFVVLACMGIAMALSVSWGLPETRGKDVSVSLRPLNVARGYAAVLKVRQFLIFALVGGMASGGLFSYITGSPSVFIDLFGFSPRIYGLIFGGNALVITAANQLNRAFLRRVSPVAVLRIITPIQSVIALLLLGVAWFGVVDKTVIVGLIACYLFCFGFILPNSMALLLQPFSRNAGSASALGGSLGMITGTVASGATSYLHDGTAVPMALMFAVFAVMGFVFVLVEMLFPSRPKESQSR